MPCIPTSLNHSFCISKYFFSCLTFSPRCQKLANQKRRNLNCSFPQSLLCKQSEIFASLLAIQSRKASTVVGNDAHRCSRTWPMCVRRRYKAGFCCAKRRAQVHNGPPRDRRPSQSNQGEGRDWKRRKQSLMHFQLCSRGNSSRSWWRRPVQNSRESHA